ncbi:MAG TPA: pyridoxine 5'-phosphate synthase [Vicinamibacterales bacterium]
MIRLSVNVNKVATLRNSRGGSVPSVTHAVNVCVDAGALGITVHPREDERHIRRSDVTEIAGQLAILGARQRGIEFNIEGDPRPGFLDLVLAVRPDQCTLVPVTRGEITSQAGWPPDTSASIRSAVARLQSGGVRVSLFVDPTVEAVRWAAEAGADRIELYTEPFARAFALDAESGRASFERYATAARLAHGLGLGINAGHDLDLENLTLFRTLPRLAEVSIGHALLSRALWVGLDRAVREYRAAVAGV